MHAFLNALSVATATSVVLSGCYVVPVNPEAYPAYPGYGYATPVPPLPVGGPAQIAATTVLQARMYPANERASQSGVLNGTISSATFGKGRFQLSYRGETLTGEATRIDGDAHRGVANAYGPSGAFMSCDYQMQSVRQGAGTCTISDGAKYQVHVGN